MHSSKNYLIVFLALATLGGAALAWKQYQELIVLRGSSLSKDERADLQKRLSDAEKRAKELADELAVLRSRPADGSEEADAMAASDAPPQDQQNRRGRRGPGGNQGGPGAAIAALMEKPEMQKLIAIQQKAQLDSRFAPLFKNLNLTPDQLDKFKNLLVEKQTAMQDVVAAARSQGIDPRADRDTFQKMVATTQLEVDANIKATLGDAGFDQYQSYQQTLPQRNVVTQLQQSLSYTGVPLSDAQAEQMVQILAQTAPKPVARSQTTTTTANAAATTTANADAGGGGIGGGLFPGGGGAGGRGGGGVTITNDAIALAQGVLTAPQVATLQQLQLQQQAQQQIQQAVRQTMTQGGNGGRTNSGGTPNAGTTGGGTAPKSPTKG